MNLESVFADIKCFCSLEGGRSFELSADGAAITYQKQVLYNVPTICRITVTRRESKRGVVSYTVKTSWADIDGRKHAFKSSPNYNDSWVYHCAADHCRNIIA